MDFVKVQPSKNSDLKAKLIKEYCSPVGDKFKNKNIDFHQVEVESKIKHMPLSFDRKTILSKQQIAQCDNFN